MGITIYSGGGNNPSFNRIINNKIYDNARLGNRGPGIGFNSGDGNVAINNIIWGNDKGFEISSASNSQLYNNTVYGNLNGIVIAAAAVGTEVVNNISFNNGRRDLDDLGVDTIVHHNLTENPLFVDARNHDFSLLSGSLCHR
ncbi:MAG: right-handed parallel beta-helix repeat-containing protein [Myxococcota bacterium]